MALRIRPIEDGDVEDVVRLWTEAGVTRPWNDPRQDIAFGRRGEHATILVAEEDGVILATAQVGEDGHRGWLYYVAVTPERQGEGLGRAVMDAAEEWLRARGVWKVQLLVRAENRHVVEFYGKLGYRELDTVCMQKVIG